MNRNNFFVNLFVAFFKITGIIPAYLFFKPKVYLEEGANRKLPTPSILVSNHCSLLDFALYVFIFPFRTIRFLMAEVLFRKGKLFSAFLYALGGIYVNRDTKDFGFVSDALEVLDAGGIVGIFPQGRLPLNGVPFPFTVSTAFIAKHTDAPIIPIYTDGNYGLRKRAHVVIGKPIYPSDWVDADLPEDELLQNLTQSLEKKIYGLKEEIS